jgi:hypothetical protein
MDLTELLTLIDATIAVKGEDAMIKLKTIKEWLES